MKNEEDTKDEDIISLSMLQREYNKEVEIR